jgi:hypothetical protein
MIIGHVLIFNRTVSTSRFNSGLLSSKVSTVLKMDEIAVLQVPLGHKGVGVLCESLCLVLFSTKSLH